MDRLISSPLRSLRSRLAASPGRAPAPPAPSSTATLPGPAADAPSGFALPALPVLPRALRRTPAAASRLTPPAQAAHPSLLIPQDPLSEAMGTTEEAPATGAEQAVPPICLCPACARSYAAPSGAPQPASALSLASGALLAGSVDLSHTFRLHSNPSASKTIYLDFDGHITSGTNWNSSYGREQIITPKFDLDGNVEVFSAAELERIQMIWLRVAEDFAPFQINVTTQDPGLAALSKGDVANDTTWGARAVIGGSCYDWFGSEAGGVSYLNVFGNPLSSPCFIFANQLGNGDEKFTAEAISHELGHTLGLSHDGNSSTAYYGGIDTAGIDWAPIMGVGYYRPLSQWSKGEYSNANNNEDDLAKISGASNGAGYRPDDVGSKLSSATPLVGLSFAQFGIIETSGDSDWFSFRSGDGAVSLSIDHAVQAWLNNGDGSFSASLLAGRSSNLDIEASLYRADGTLISTSNPVDSLSAGFQLTLTAGTYVLKINGVGSGDPRSGGYSDYASLGQYLISGTVASTASLVVSAEPDLILSESGDSALFSVRLSEAPSAEVLVNLSLSDAGEATLSTGQLRFDAGNWASPQTVILSGRDDLLVDGGQTFTVRLATSSTDPTYQGLADTLLTARTSDDDRALPLEFAPSLGNLVNTIAYATAPLVSGKVSAASRSDDQRLQISEGLIKSANSTRASALDGYRWQFDNLINASELLFEGYRTISDSRQIDNFNLQISTNNGSSWSQLLTVSNSVEATITARLAAPISGSALVRVIDSNRTAGSSAIDSLFVDRIALLGQQTDLRSELSLITTTSQALENNGTEGVFTLRRSGDSSQALDVAFTLGGTASASDYTVLDAAGAPLQGSIRLDAGQSSASIRIRPVADGRSETSETVLLSLQAPAAPLADSLRLGSASSDRVVIADGLLASSGRVASPYAAATSDQSLFGSVSGGVTATASADGIVQTIREVPAGSDANASSQLEHRWSFQNLSAVNQLALKASTAGGEEAFRLEISTNGGSSWRSIQTLPTRFSGTGFWTLPSTISGNAIVRLIDSNRNAGAGLLDSISIDALLLLPSSAPLPF